MSLYPLLGICRSLKASMESHFGRPVLCRTACCGCSEALAVLRYGRPHSQCRDLCILAPLIPDISLKVRCCLCPVPFLKELPEALGSGVQLL